MLQRWVIRLRALVRRERVEADFDEELRYHLEREVERGIARGMTPGEARRVARRELGDPFVLKEEARDTWRWRRVDELVQDVAYAIRMVRRAPGFTAVVVATLALGIGGTTAVFSVVRAVLLAPLPYEQPGRLVRFYQQEAGNPSTRYFLTGVHFKELRDDATSFESVAALDTYSETGLDLVQDGRAQRLRVLEVTSDYFRTLRSGALRGREFEREDEAGSRRVVLSHALWRVRFDGDPSMIGSTVRLSGETYEVIGIAPPGFEDPIVGAVDAWIPGDLAGNTSEQNYSLTAVGRLRNGVQIEQAATELAALSRAMMERWPAARRNAVVVVPLKEDLVAAARGPLRLLGIAVGLVLLVACVNVANLVLARGTGRVQEFAVRAALGSGGFRIARQLLVESVVVAVLGGVLGFGVAVLGVDALRVVGGHSIPRLEGVGFEPGVLAFAALVTLGTAVAFGVAPALRFARVQPNRALGRQARATTAAARQVRLRSGMAAAQLALALTLLAGTGVLIASFRNLEQVDLGFRGEHVLAFNVNLPSVRYDAGRRAAFQEELARRLESIPGVAAAGGISRLPATGSYHPWGTHILTGPLAGTSVRQPEGIQQRTVSGDVFSALGIPVLAGRTFDDRDGADAPSRAVVSASFARRAFPDMPFEQVVGQRIAIVVGRDREREIIGVVGDVALDTYGAPAFVVYHAHRQFADNRNWALTQVVSTGVPPERILAAVRDRVAALDPELVVYDAAPLSDVVGRGVGRERFALVLMGAFAAVALLLATLGLYGVLSCTMRERTHEIGIRVALGATAGDVRTLVLRQAAVVVGFGLVAGMAGALVLGRWLSSLLFQVSPRDPRVLLATSVVLVITALLAAWLPARRAARIAPTIAMRET